MEQITNTMEQVKFIASFLGAIGVPTIGALVAWAVKQIKSIREENRRREKEIREENQRREEAQTKALQMIIRSQLMTIYRHATSKGCISEEDIELWKAEYEMYHGMGKNGVMDAKDKKIEALDIVTHY